MATALQPSPSELPSHHRAHVEALQAQTAAALAAAGLDALVLHSGAAQKRTSFDDQHWTLRPTPHLVAWLPIAEPGCALLVRPGARPRLYRPRVLDFWEGPAPSEVGPLLGPFEVEEGSAAALAESLKAALPARAAFIGDDAEAAAALGLGDRQNPPDLLRALDELRVWKSPYEERCLAEANRRAAEGHAALRRLFAEGEQRELELHLAYLSRTAQDDAETPYKNIVALGAHAATLHHVQYGKRAAASAGSLLVDAGAQCCGYGSDITRTWVRGSGAAADLFAQLVAEVEAMQLRLCALALPGLPYESLHDEAHRQLAESFCKLGLGRASPGELVERQITRAFFPHGLGHSLGVQTHDVGCALVKPRPDNPFLRNTRTIAPRQCFTIEPGVYFIDQLLAPLRAGPHAQTIDWRLVAQLAPFGGVRIEDDLVVGGQAPRNLTRELLPVGGGRA